MIAFIIWAAVGVVFVIYGIICFQSKREKPFGFWSNAKTLPMKDVKGYNHALSKLWIVFGAVFILLGVPLLMGQNSGLILISVVGAMFEAIGIMIIYVIKIEPKYKQ